ncbi:type II toxin-antitoxin system VapC family toxin [Frankia sp. Cppng1_Ct_nod]|uniref:type II toxin-antitoxin system VapC family toxin n=1 Tax=Frankia sp. Cppng1_Ct_nod TaxID=2897162 RepID=UPI0010414640|nr:type II toxin-antitoxin system VapC family toxin [Frankia sp. Cppng1_Ct_nod]
MIVLDANVISELMHPRADPVVVAWVDAQTVGDVYLTAVTTAELRYGVACLPAGRRRADLADRVRRTLEEDFPGRILPFDDEAASHFAEIVVSREHHGLPVSTADAQIAAICRSYSAGLATRNAKDFVHTEVELIDPWHDGGTAIDSTE